MKKGTLIFDRDYEELVPASEANMSDKVAEWRFLTYEDVFDWQNGKIELDTYQSQYVTPGGETVVAFGWYGFA